MALLADHQPAWPLDPKWFAKDQAFRDLAELFMTPDHYVFRMLHSQGIPLEAMGVPHADGGETE